MQWPRMVKLALYSGLDWLINSICYCNCFVLFFRYPITDPRPGCTGDLLNRPGVRTYGIRDPAEKYDVYCFVDKLNGKLLKSRLCLVFLFYSLGGVMLLKLFFLKNATTIPSHHPLQAPEWPQSWRATSYFSQCLPKSRITTSHGAKIVCYTRLPPQCGLLPTVLGNRFAWRMLRCDRLLPMKSVLFPAGLLHPDLCTTSQKRKHVAERSYGSYCWRSASTLSAEAAVCQPAA